MFTFLDNFLERRFKLDYFPHEDIFIAVEVQECFRSIVKSVLDDKDFKNNKQHYLFNKVF